MQPIERYGLVALLFVFVTVVGVVSWDFSDSAPDGSKSDRTVHAAESGPKGPASTRARDSEQDPEAARMALKTRPRAIERESLSIDEPGAKRNPERVADARRNNRRDREGGYDDPNTAAGAPQGAQDDRGRSGRPIELRRDTEAGLVAQGEDASQLDSRYRYNSPPPASSLEPATELRPRTRQQETRQPDPVRNDSAAGTPGVYVVKGGDTLSEISLSQLGTSKLWKEIVAANPGLDPGKLRVGARLRMPSGSAPVATNTKATAKSSRPSSAAPVSAGAGETVRVRSGDSLWKIAARALGNGERWKEIAALNPRINPDRLAVGQEIVLPRGAQAARIVNNTTPRKNASSSKQGVVH
jgi:nucleoid-associated protein YgaU